MLTYVATVHQTRYEISKCLARRPFEYSVLQNTNYYLRGCVHDIIILRGVVAGISRPLRWRTPRKIISTGRAEGSFNAYTLRYIPSS